MNEKPPSFSERLMLRLREAGLPIPIGSQCVRNPLLQANNEESPWSWYVKGPNGRPLPIGSWDTMTSLVRAKGWEIWTEKDGSITVNPLVYDPDVNAAPNIDGTSPRYHRFEN